MAAAIRAKAEGADINTKEGAGRCPLQVASRHGHLSLVTWLLQAGALDLSDGEGVSALQSACKHGHASVAAVLLDRGCDVHHANQAGAAAVDVAGAAGQTVCVRLLEARACPFAWSVTLHCPSFFGDSWKERWVAVYRARPWDNPMVDRARVVMYMYEGREAAQAERVMLRPCLVHVARGVGGIVDVDLACESFRRGGGSSALPGAPLRLRMDGATYEWLNAVLHDSFAEGRGAAFDPATGLVRQPPQFLAYAAQYATTAFGGAPLAPMPPQPPPPPQQQQQQQGLPAYMMPSAPPAYVSGGGGGSGAPSSGGGYSYPSAPPAPYQQPAYLVGASQQQQQQQQQYPPRQQPSAASAAPLVRQRPAYLHQGILDMQKALAEGTLLPPGAPEPRATYICSITQVRALTPPRPAPHPSPLADCPRTLPVPTLLPRPLPGADAGPSGDL